MGTFKFYRYDMVNYMPFFRANTASKDKPFTIYHVKKFDKFDYLGNIYKYVMELDDVEDFFTDNALFHLKKSTYPSKTVDFLGNNDFIETYFLKNGNLECYEFKLIDNKKVKMD